MNSKAFKLVRDAQRCLHTLEFLRDREANSYPSPVTGLNAAVTRMVVLDTGLRIIVPEALRHLDDVLRMLVPPGMKPCPVCSRDLVFNDDIACVQCEKHRDVELEQLDTDE